MLLLLNLLIAIMSETYIRLSKLKSGLLHMKIINVMPVYKYEKTYSCLISAPAPLNVLSFLVLPYFMFNKNVKRNKE